MTTSTFLLPIFFELICDVDVDIRLTTPRCASRQGVPASTCGCLRPHRDRVDTVDASILSLHGVPLGSAIQKINACSDSHLGREAKGVGSGVCHPLQSRQSWRRRCSRCGSILIEDVTGVERQAFPGVECCLRLQTHSRAGQEARSNASFRWRRCCVCGEAFANVSKSLFDNTTIRIAVKILRYQRKRTAC